MRCTAVTLYLFKIKHFIQEFSNIHMYVSVDGSSGCIFLYTCCVYLWNMCLCDTMRAPCVYRCNIYMYMCYPQLHKGHNTVFTIHLVVCAGGYFKEHWGVGTLWWT